MFIRIIIYYLQRQISIFHIVFDMSPLSAELFLSIYFSTSATALPTLQKRKGGGKARGGGGSSSSSSMTRQQWKIFGIVIGSLIGAAIIGYIVWHVYIHRRRKATRNRISNRIPKTSQYDFPPLTEKRFTFSYPRRDQYTKVPPSPSQYSYTSSPLPSPGYPLSYSSSDTYTYSYSPAAPGRVLLNEPGRY